MNSSLAPHEDISKADFEHLISIVEGRTDFPGDLDDVTKAHLEEIIEFSAKHELDPKQKPELTRHHFSNFWRRFNDHTSCPLPWDYTMELTK